MALEFFPRAWHGRSGVRGAPRTRTRLCVEGNWCGCSRQHTSAQKRLNICCLHTRGLAPLTRSAGQAAFLTKRAFATSSSLNSARPWCTPEHPFSSRRCRDPTITPGGTTVAFSWPSRKALRPTSSSKRQGGGNCHRGRDGRLSQRFFSRYSTNEGETWKTFTFSEKPVFVYGLLTEPGEKSTIFTIFGSYKESGHSWLILQINTTDVLGKGMGDTACDGGRAVLLSRLSLLDSRRRAREVGHLNTRRVQRKPFFLVPSILLAKREMPSSPVSSVGARGERASPVGNHHPLSGALSLVDAAAEGARVPSLLAEGFVEKQKGKKKKKAF